MTVQMFLRAVYSPVFRRLITAHSTSSFTVVRLNREDSLIVPGVVGFSPLYL